MDGRLGSVRSDGGVYLPLHGDVEELAYRFGYLPEATGWAAADGLPGSSGGRSLLGPGYPHGDLARRCSAGAVGHVLGDGRRRDPADAVRKHARLAQQDPAVRRERDAKSLAPKRLSTRSKLLAFRLANTH